MNSRKLFVLFMVMLMTFGAYDVLAGCEKGCEGCPGCDEETTIKVFGESRYRISMNGYGLDHDYDTPWGDYEYPFPKNLSFDKEADNVWFSEMRSRIAVKAIVGGNKGAIFQLQDSRVVGMDPGTEMFTNDNHNHRTGLHQAYLWYKPCEKGWFKLGRFELGLHNGRFIDPWGWHGIGRTFEGFATGRTFNDNIKGLLWATKMYESFGQYETIDEETAGDDMLYGVNIDFTEHQVELFGVWYRSFGWEFGDFDKLDDPFDMSVMMFGAYSARTFAENFDYQAMVVMETGEVDDGGDNNSDEDGYSQIDLSGMLLFAEVGYTLEDNGARFAVRYDSATGDDPETMDKWEGYHDMFSDSHTFGGQMDVFAYDRFGILSNGDDLGLVDIAVLASYPINEKWSAGGEYHMFKTHQEYEFGDDETSKSIGTEIDLGVTFTDGAFQWTSGYSTFSMHDDFFADYYGADDEDHDTSTGWFFTQCTVEY